MRRILELRVHGVSGTPPEELLDRPLVRQVAGDPITGFYRPRLPSEALDEPYPPADQDDPAVEAHLEGYAWGGLTSGAPSRALWLPLIPFALINMAPRLRPASLFPFQLSTLLYLSRLIALASTMTLTLGVSGIGIGLVGWQCGGPHGAVCSVLPGWLRESLAGLSPAARLLLGALVPTVFLLIMWLISRKTVERYEEKHDSQPEPPPTDPAASAGPSKRPTPEDPDPSLEHPWMWRGTHMVRRLRGAHMRAAILVVVLLLAASLPGPGLRAAVLAVATVALAVTVAALGIPSFVGRRDPKERKPDGQRTTPLLSWLPTVSWRLTRLAMAVLVIALGIGGIEQGPASPPGLPGYHELLTVLLFVQMMLVVGLVVVGRGQWRDPLRGLGTPLFATFGILLGAAFTAGVYVLAANWLTTGNTIPTLSVAGLGGNLAVPMALRVTAVAFGATLLYVVGVAAWQAVVLRKDWKRPVHDANVSTEYPCETCETTAPRDERRIRQIRFILWQARLIDRADRVAVLLIGPPMVAAVLVTSVNLAVTVGWPPAVELTAQLSSIGWLAMMLDGLYRLGAYAAALLLVLLITLGALAFRAPSTRRSVGILWDLAAFWPRSVHPLAPPCYAERTVPDIKQRIRWWVDEGGDPLLKINQVVLAAHSQGSVLSAAALLQLAAADKVRASDGREPLLPHVAFLSYGCVLHRLYAAYFPAYFAPKMLTRLAVGLGRDDPDTGLRWRNLWRTSDYLGGPIQRDDPDGRRPLVDPTRKLDKHLIDPEFAVQPGELGYPRPHRHTGYSSDKQFQAAVRELADLLPGIDHRTGTSKTSGQRRRRVSSTALAALRTAVIVGATFASARWWTVSRSGRSTGQHAPR